MGVGYHQGKTVLLTNRRRHLCRDAPVNSVEMAHVHQQVGRDSDSFGKLSNDDWRSDVMVFTRNAVTLNRDKLPNLAPSNVDGGIITILQDHYARSMWRFPHVFHFPDVEEFRMESLSRMELKGTFGAGMGYHWVAFFKCRQLFFC